VSLFLLITWITAWRFHFKYTKQFISLFCLSVGDSLNCAHLPCIFFCTQCYTKSDEIWFSLASLITLFSIQIFCLYPKCRPPVWSSSQSTWLQIQRSQVRFQALPDFLRSRGYRTGSIYPREYN
jgi:hypothetical protein